MRGRVTALQVAILLTVFLFASNAWANPEANVVPITVNGSDCNFYLNEPCVAVTVCTPGTSTCQTISGILLDTGSYGLRIFKQALSVSLTQVTVGSGSLAECVQYADGSSDWGPVKTASVILGNEPAVQVPIQVIDYTFGHVPSTCGTPDQSPSQAGYNGILGVGPFVQDCGETCVSEAVGQYYTCSSSTCSGIAVPLGSQVQNPVALLPIDNNGIIVQLPSVPAGGEVSVSGSLVLGIGTQDNNSPSGTTYTLDENGEFTTTFNSRSYSSFIDTGSNGLFFPSSGLLPACTGASSGWYCPSTMTNLSATITGASGSPSSVVSFQIGNFNSLLNSTNNNVFADIGGNGVGGFDWGLPFYFGRNTYMGFEGKGSSLGTGPYFAFANPPTAATNAATNITSNSATLNATVNPNGLLTTAYFQWGTSTSYGNTTASRSLGSGSSNLSVSVNLSSLSANTTYHYRIVATNSAGTTYGSDATFKTSSTGTAPTATTGSATNVTSNSATLNATVNPNGLLTTAYFQWGTSTSFKNTTASRSLGSGSSNLGVSANLSRLKPNTTYYYRIVATNSQGTTFGSLMSFTTR